jgi:hypothetical protein
MLFALLYALLRRVIGSGRSGPDRELEVEVVLRHQVRVLSRKAGRPKLRRIDEAFLAACSRALPRRRWGSFGATRRLQLERPHRGPELRAPLGEQARLSATGVPQVLRIDLLGGLIHEYELVAA